MAGVSLGTPYESPDDNCVNENFGHFSPQNTNYTITRVFREEVQTKVPFIDSSRTVQFELGASPYFLNLAETRLELSNCC